MSDKLKEFFDYMSSRNYHIGNDIYAKYYELMASESEEDVDLYPVEYLGRDYDSKEYSVEVIRLKNDDGGFYDGLLVSVTRKSDNKKEEVDNDIWLRNFLIGKEEDPMDILDLHGRRFLKSVIKDLISIGWLHNSFD